MKRCKFCGQFMGGNDIHWHLHEDGYVYQHKFGEENE